MRSFLLALTFIVISVTSSYSQIYYEIELNEDLEQYVLSLHSDVEWADKTMNRTSTAQMTIRAKHGTFYPEDVKSLTPGVVWQHNATYESPEEAEGYDYFSFGLLSIGTSNIKYTKGGKTPIISFSNKLDCSESVSLISNEDDPFLYPNKSSANIANHISILGTFKSNGYSGNVNETIVPCQNLKTVDHKNFLREHFDIYPNPVVTTTNLSSDWPFDDIEVEAEILDLAGKSISRKNIMLKKGTNNFEFDLTSASSGIYYIKLQSSEWQVTIDEVAKVE